METVMIIILLGIILSSFYFWQNFPSEVPTHWNISGEPDDWSGKTFAAFFFPAVIIGIYLLMLILPKIDPLKNRYRDFGQSYNVIRLVLVLFFALIYATSSLSGLGYDMPIQNLVMSGVGIMFILLGYLLPRVKKNWFVGIRTPWTLSSETVWQKTHKLGGKLFLLAGFLMIIGSFLSGETAIATLIIAIITAALIPMIYSWWLWRKMEINN